MTLRVGIPQVSRPQFPVSSVVGLIKGTQLPARILNRDRTFKLNHA